MVRYVKKNRAVLVSLCAFAPLRETNPKRSSRVGIPVISRKGAKGEKPFSASLPFSLRELR
jgi:hypothetical protein